jgi:hypothetical protein
MINRYTEASDELYIGWRILYWMNFILSWFIKIEIFYL